MKKITILAALLYSMGSLVAQEVVEFQLEREGKTTALKSDGYITFEQDITGDSLEYGTISYTGEVVSADKESVVIIPSSKDVEWNRGDGNWYNSTLSYNWDYDGQVTIPTQTLSSIWYQSSFQEAVSISSGIMAGLGLAAAFYAPLFSINYRTWDFNQDRYYTIAGIGLATATLTLPIAIATSGKSFTLKDIWESNKPVWSVYE